MQPSGLAALTSPPALGPATLATAATSLGPVQPPPPLPLALQTCAVPHLTQARATMWLVLPAAHRLLPAPPQSTMPMRQRGLPRFQALS